ncbi:receptor-like protein 7 [Selaginella moellendorffii]|uniref:receptor-like protein 7 n=1 Tax=Selaginella moellendorffii TaxID=88036 RepID=UPI000D1CFBA8|nr:receptor-like protein 7 [Selaginella moellendorffii]|eukprot:XP_024532797.1 receptor-like protein 7 [Selaginella moellendorffii]
MEINSLSHLEGFKPSFPTGNDGDGDRLYQELFLQIKGRENIGYEYVLRTTTLLDLSSNSLSGEVPPNLGDLSGLRFLNLSHNNISSRLPRTLGKLKLLEQLDMSDNHLYGEIPVELEELNTLSSLNLSSNTLSGRIPTGGQFNTFVNSSYAGNPNLCGRPLSKACSQQRVVNPEDDADCQEARSGWWDENVDPIAFGVGCSISFFYSKLLVIDERGRLCPAHQILHRLSRSRPGQVRPRPDPPLPSRHQHLSHQSHRRDVVVCMTGGNTHHYTVILIIKVKTNLECLSDNMFVVCLLCNEPLTSVLYHLDPLISFAMNPLLLALTATKEAMNDKQAMDEHELLLRLQSCRDLRAAEEFPPTTTLVMFKSSISLAGCLGETLTPSSLGLLISLPSTSLLMLFKEKFLSKLHNLTSLNLQSNNLSSNIPIEMGKLLKLKYMKLRDNFLSGNIRKEFGCLKDLQVLSLPNNFLTGPLPKELGSLEQLQLLALGMNNITGEIPTELGMLKRLEILGLDYNSLNSTIPESLGNSSSLVQIHVGQNPLLHPKIPTSLGQLKNLEYFSMFDVTSVSGQIPPEVGNCTKLQWFDINGDFSIEQHINGPIPLSLLQIPSLTTLGLYHLNLTHLQLPNELWNMSQLQYLSMGNTGCEGTLSSQIGDMTNLTYLNLGTNTHIKGVIPEEIDRCERLMHLSLDGNMLSGHIPHSLGKLHYLKYLKLGSNGLSGEIPSSLVQLSNLEALQLENNIFTGKMPLSLGQLKSLQLLYLFNNKFVGRMKGLQKLDISAKSFEGEMLVELANFTSLQLLELSKNNLTGEIPWEAFETLCKHNFQTLGMERNKLVGHIPRVLLENCTKLERE